MDGGALGRRRGAARTLRPRTASPGAGSGFSQTEGPLLSLAAYGGVPLVSFAVALTGALLAAAVLALHRAWRTAGDAGERGRALRAVALTVAGVLAVPLVGALAWLPLPGPLAHRGRPDVDRRA